MSASYELVNWILLGVAALLGLAMGLNYLVLLEARKRNRDRQSDEPDTFGAHATLVVTFEVDRSRSASLIDGVKSIGDWSALTSSSYLITTSIGAGSVMERLQPLLGPADSLWVIPASGPWAACGTLRRPASQPVADR